MPETEKPQKLSDEERAARMRKPYEKATQEYLEEQRKMFIDRGWGDPDLWTEQDLDRITQTPLTDADLPRIIKERGKRWGRWNQNT